MKTRMILTVLMALLVNTCLGAAFADLLAFPAWTGAVGLNIVGFAMSFIPMPSGIRLGVYTEVWTGKVVEHFTHVEDNTFMNGIPDFSQHAENDVIHLADVAGDPDVLIDNTTYPLEIQNIDGEDIAIKLSKFETKPTRITDDELYALSFDKMALVKTRHGNKIGESRLDKAIHAFAPAENTAETPVLLTTGAVADGRKKLLRADVLLLKAKLDKLKCPKSGRRLVLCNDHVNDLLEEDQKFANQYHNYESGVISKMYGFEIMEYVNCPAFGQNLKKKGFGSVSADGDFEASVFFYVPRMFKASGTTKMYYSEAKTDPVNKQNLVSFTNRFVALPQKRQGACGAIVSAKATA